MRAGDIAVVRTTGEKVYVIQQDATTNLWIVRRPQVAENGGIEHQTDRFFAGELSSIPDYASELIEEMKLKARKQRELLIEEVMITEEVEQECQMAKPAEKPKEPKIN
jgi:hypothetical protein